MEKEVFIIAPVPGETVHQAGIRAGTIARVILMTFLSSLFALPTFSQSVPPTPMTNVFVAALSKNIEGAARINELIRRLELQDRAALNLAKEELVEIGQPAVPLLIEALKNKSFEISRYSAQILGKIGDVKAVVPLLAVIRGNNTPDWLFPFPMGPDSSTYITILYALAGIGKPAVPVLIEALKDNNEDVVEVAVGALGEIGDQKTLPALKEIAENYPTKKIRGAAKTAIEEIQGAQKKPAGDDSGLRTPNLREKSSASIPREGITTTSQGPEPIQKIEGPRSVESLVKDLSSDDKYVRSSAALSLVIIKDPRAVEPLIKVLLEDKDRDVRSSAALALTYIEDTRATEPFIAALSDSDSSVRFYAARALGNLEDLRAVKPLIKVLSDKDVRVRAAAAFALGMIKDESAIDKLKELAGNDKEKFVRQAASYAVKVLESIKDPRIVELLPEFCM